MLLIVHKIVAIEFSTSICSIKTKLIFLLALTTNIIEYVLLLIFDLLILTTEYCPKEVSCFSDMV
jgi:hypothetical protein